MYNSVVDIFKVNTNNALSTEARAKMLESIIALNIKAVLCKSPMDGGIIIIHQLSKVKGDLLNPKVEYFRLKGFGPSAIPIRFCPKSILTVSEVEAPSWTTINAIVDSDGLDAVHNSNPTIMDFANAILLPSFLTEVIAPFSSLTTSKVFFLCTEAGAKYDDVKGANDSPASSSLKTLLPFLWATNKSSINPVQTSNRVSVKMFTS